MSKPHLTLKLVGDDRNDLVDFEVFVRFCESIIKCLHKAEEVVGQKNSKPQLQYRIADLELGSAKVTLEAKRAFRGNDRRVFSMFTGTLTDIKKGKVDPRYSIDDLEPFRELSQSMARGVRYAKIGRLTITPEFAETIDNMKAGSVEATGSVTGTLERVNLHNKNEVVLYTSLPGHYITCIFGDDQLDKVREALKRRVTVYGAVFHRSGRPFPDRVKVRDIEIHPNDEDLPTLHDVRNLGEWGTGGLSSVEFIRAIRDEQIA